MKGPGGLKPIRGLRLNRVRTEAQILFTDGSFLYLRADPYGRYALGPGAERVAGFALHRDGVDLLLVDGTRLALRLRWGRLRAYFS